MKHNFYRSLLIAFSLAALSLFAIWDELWNTAWYFDYPGFEYEPFSLGIALFWMFVWTGLLTVLLNLKKPFIAQAVTGIILFITVNSIRVHFGLTRQWLGVYSLAGIAIFGILFLSFLIIKYRSSCWKFLQKGLIIASPFAFFVTAKAILSLISLPETSENHDSPIAKYVQKPPRVLWMIFDEMDIRLAFEHRGQLALPNLEKFKNESLFATQAFSAGSCTIHSIPAMLTGLNLQKPKILSDRNIKFTRLDSKQEVTLNAVPNVFTKAKSKNLRTAIIGNYHPYNRIFSHEANYILPTCIPETSFIDKFIVFSQLLFHKIISKGIPFVSSSGFLGETVLRNEFIKCYKHIKNHALKFGCDPTFDFIFVHWPIPHHPGIYQSSSKQFVPSYPANYLDNLSLVDDAIGEVRLQMEKTELWDRTTIIITSDHWLRKINLDTSNCQTLDPSQQTLIRQPDCRVPLLIKMAYANEPTVYNGKFRMFHIHDLVEALLERKVQTTEELLQWLQGQEQHFTLEGLDYL